MRTLEKEYHADRSMICKWVKKYIAVGESTFVHKGHPGNPFAALHVSKNLSEVERLRLTAAKLEVENERLKKGYLAKGVGDPRSSLLAEKRVRGHWHAQIQIWRIIMGICKWSWSGACTAMGWGDEIKSASRGKTFRRDLVTVQEIRSGCRYWQMM